MASIAKRPDGSWRARYRDEAGREHSRHFPRKVDAQRWLDETTAAVVTGIYADPRSGRVTWRAFYASWSTRQVWAPGTVLAMNLTAGDVTFADVPMKAIRRSHVEQWVKAMQGRGLAATTMHTRVNNARAVFRGAVGDRIIGTDPSAGVTLPRRRRAAAAMNVPEPTQVGALLSQAAGGPFAAFVGLCAFAGLRLGEAAGVQVDDVDFLRRTLHVRRQVQRAGGGLVDIRAPKYGSERVVFLPQGLVDLLAAHIGEHCPGEDRERWLFSGAEGLPPHQNTVSYRWRRAAEAAGLVDVRLHDLRHFYASGLIAAGCDVVTVQRALGHASATTTLGTYAHLWPSAEDRTREAAQGLLAQALATPADLVRTSPGG